LSLRFRLLDAFESITLAADLTAVALPASHADEEELALNYLLTAGGRSLVIGNDTGWWAPEVWEFLQQQTLHVVVMDCTSGPLGTGPRAAEKSWVGSHHLNCEWVVEVRDELARRGALAEDCRFIANHFSHNGGWLHDQLEEYFTPRGILVGYDGMEVEV
jgi:phosphoribosyl 1,2-cyclic phosphate phosphodiesterase